MQRRRAAWPLAALLLASTSAMAASENQLVLIGTYTLGGSRGIYEVRLDNETGALSAPVLAAETPNPSFLAMAPSRRFIYAHADVGTLPDGRAAGGIRAFALDPDSGRLTALNERATGDPFPSNVAIDATGQLVATVSGTGGHLTTFHVNPDGSLGPIASRRATAGTPGPVPVRQVAPYPHSTNFAPDNRFAVVCDLGADRLFSYRVDAASGKLGPDHPPFAQLPRGTGPRHAKFSADGRFLYVVGELSNTVTACRYDAATGRIEPFQRLSTVPAGVRNSMPDNRPDSTASEIRLERSQRFVYAANRGDDSIAVFARDPDSGALALVEIVKSGGKTPRNFAISPDGKWLLCAHLDSDNLTVFRIDGQSGRLSRMPGVAAVPKGICVVFVN
jgi:6-phosphogluconolactonase